MLRDNFEELKNAIIDFYRVTGIMMVLYDEYGHSVYSYPPRNNPFCAEIRRSEMLYDRCMECDWHGLERCKRDRALYIYECHIGLIEAVTPIIEFDNVLGYLMMGQVLPEGGENKVRAKIDELPEDISVSKKELRQALSSMNCYSRETLSAAARIMDMCTCYISTNQFLPSSQGAIVSRIDRYVNDNLASEELSVDSVCRHFLISRSTLYTLSKNAFGMGISDRIRYLRIERAKRMLTGKNRTIAEISRECGFNEPNYFTKTFKRITGILPKDYAQSVSRENK